MYYQKINAGHFGLKSERPVFPAWVRTGFAYCTRKSCSLLPESQKSAEIWAFSLSLEQRTPGTVCEYQPYLYRLSPNALFLRWATTHQKAERRYFRRAVLSQHIKRFYALPSSGSAFSISKKCRPCGLHFSYSAYFKISLSAAIRRALSSSVLTATRTYCLPLCASFADRSFTRMSCSVRSLRVSSRALTFPVSSSMK